MDLDYCDSRGLNFWCKKIPELEKTFGKAKGEFEKGKIEGEKELKDFKDKEAIEKLAEKSDIITYEIESGNSDVLKSVEKNAEIEPSPETLKIIQDKFCCSKFNSYEDADPIERDRGLGCCGTANDMLSKLHKKKNYFST